MFIVNNSNSEILKAFASLFNKATKNLEFPNDVIISSDSKLEDGFQYGQYEIIIKDDFSTLISQFGKLGSFSVISERLFSGLYMWLVDYYDETSVNEQFTATKNEIISKFINVQNETITNYLKFLLMQDSLIFLSEKEKREIKIQQTFGGHYLNIRNVFNFATSKPVTISKPSIIEARLKNLKIRYANKAVLNKITDNSKDLSLLTYGLSQEYFFNDNPKDFYNIKYSLADIKASFIATYKSYFTSTSEFQVEELNRHVESVLLHVKTEADDDFSNKVYTFFDALLIVSFCFIKKINNQNTYLSFISNTHINKPNSLSPKNIKSEGIFNILFKQDDSKKKLNKDFNSFISKLSELVNNHLIIGTKDQIDSISSSYGELQNDYIGILDFHYNFPNSKYVLHQLYKDYFIYYFKGFDDLKQIVDYIQQCMYSCHSRNCLFDIFTLNEQLANVLQNYSYKDIEGINNNDVCIPNDLNFIQINVLATLKSKTLLSFFEDVHLMKKYTSKLAQSRNNKK